MKVKTIYRKHAKEDCTASDNILTDSGVSCVNCGVDVIEHIAEPSDNQKLLAFLADEYNRYHTEIVPLLSDANDFESFDEAKNEFLESLWDVVSQHFADAN
jgi:hypothetical protein